jgi:hypothetical protein
LLSIADFDFPHSFPIPILAEASGWEEADSRFDHFQVAFQTDTDFAVSIDTENDFITVDS